MRAVCLCLNVHSCEVLIESVFLIFYKAHSVLFCMEPQEAIAGGCETEVDGTFSTLGFRCTFASWYLAFPLLFLYDHPVGCGI